MNPRLLLLEDEPTSRDFLAAAARALPADVDVATSLAQAEALATDGGHALWLFDVNLPDGSGSELLARLRERGLDAPALAHTAAQDAAERERLLADGFLDVVIKPLSAAAWQRAIRQALARRPAVAAPLSTTPGDPAALPPWDDAGAAIALGGDSANVAALRQLFLAELPASRDAVGEAAARGDHAAMRATLHRLRAGCGFVGAARLQAASALLHAAPESAAALDAFTDAVDRTLATADTRAGG